MNFVSSRNCIDYFSFSVYLECITILINLTIDMSNLNMRALIFRIINNDTIRFPPISIAYRGVP